jgi:sterol desaturase/sphingolipid hydroxylase (fatty acid hydroxylase superfamily)
MTAQAPSPAGRRTIVWRNVTTVVSAAILIASEVFGVAFAGGWALAVLFGLDDTTSHILQGILFVVGLYVMFIFLRHAQTVEPFVRRG